MSRIKSKFKLQRFLPVIVILLFSILLLLPQLLNHGMIVGDDCWFHMNRAYEAMMQIKTGHYSYFLDLFSFNRAGRIVTGLYGPLGSYLEGLLLLIVKTWYRWEIANSLIVLIVSGLSVYYIAKKLGSSTVTSILSGLLYMISFPFDRWVLSNNFDGLGAMLLPWILLAGYRVYVHKFSTIKLALIVTLVAQIHLMSAFVGINSILLSFILANFKKGRLQLWLKSIEAAGLCLLLTINLWGSLLEMKLSNYLVPTWPYHGFVLPNNAINLHMIFKPTQYQLVTELLILLAVGVLFLLFKNFNTVTVFLLIQSLYFMWISSNYFPWVKLLKRDSMISSYIQFPERFLPLAICGIILLIARLKPWWLMGVLLVLPIIINVNANVKNERWRVNTMYQSTVLNSRNVIMNRHTSKSALNTMLNGNHPGIFIRKANNRVPDYMPFAEDIKQSDQYYQTRPDQQNQQEILNNKLPIHYSVAVRDTAKLTFNAKPHRQIQLPFVKYAHTKLWLNHRIIRPKLTQIHAIVLKPSQRHNVLEAQYQPSRWYEALAWVEVVSWLSVIITMIVLKIRRP